MTDTPKNRDILRGLILDSVVDLVNNHIDTITEQFVGSEDGKHRVSIGVALTRLPNKAHCKATIAASRKWSDEVEDTRELEDPNQGKLL